MKRALLNIKVLGIILFFAITTTYAQTPQEIAKIGQTSSVSLTMNNNNSGSGFFVLPDQIATCYHVIKGASSGYISSVLQPGKKYPIIGITAIDRHNDLVILKVWGVNETPLPIGDSDAVVIQDEIYAVGSPLGKKEFEGMVTDGRITIITTNRIIMDAKINRGNSGGALLNSNKVVGVVQGSWLDIEPGLGNIAQGLNIAVPSKYLTPLVENANKAGTPLKPLNADGVTGGSLTWSENFYEFSLRNQRSETIQPNRCLVLFYDNKGELLCVDKLEKSFATIYPGGALRVIRDSAFTGYLNHIYYRPDGLLSDYPDFHGPVSPNIKSLVKSYEIRILDMNIGSPSFYPYGKIESLKGVVGGELIWSGDGFDLSYTEVILSKT